MRTIIHNSSVSTTPPRVNSQLQLVALFAALLLTTFLSKAMDFNAGTYYFDNSKVKFNSVRFIAGNNATVSTFVIEMDTVAGKPWWKFSIGENLSDVDYYAFIESEMDADTIMMAPELFFENLVEQQVRTSMLKESYAWAYNYPGWVFCPVFNVAQCDGYWRPTNSYNGSPSRTVPVIHINTKDSTDIASKEYISANIWIDNCDLAGFESLGTETEPLEMEIKGRGNWTWLTSHKKPYKIKFAKKQSPLGLTKSKHFVLRVDTQDWSGYLRNETGFEVSRLLNMPYTTSQLPVEVILNGEYMGMYLFCEHIRVEKGRVDIVDQEDNETDPEKITGGWLLETRGYESTAYHQFENNDPNGLHYFLESHTPEVLSEAQSSYLANLISKTDSCIFVPEKNDRGWEQYIDINSLARFYVIHEIMENVESFDGSLYMFKEIGDSTKLNFGPVWDFDNSYAEGTTQDRFIYDYTYYPFLWIKEIVKFPRFQEELRKVWKEFMQMNGLSKIRAHAAEWRNLIQGAEQADKVRWRTYASAHGENKPAEFLDWITHKVQWLNEQWGEKLPGDVNADGRVNVSDVTALVNMILRIEPTNFDTADVNGDRRLNTSDLTALINIILGIQ